jgi:CheY-like chemotaxis protein
MTKTKILIVDDEETLCEVLKLNLSQYSLILNSSLMFIQINHPLSLRCAQCFDASHRPLRRS